jgi:hypothetical protein
MNNMKGGGSKRKRRETLAIIERGKERKIKWGRDKERKIKWKRGGK